MHQTNIITQIKRDVTNHHEKNYLMTRQKQELKYYSLYLPSIVTIQKWFRRCLVKKTRYLQEQIKKQLQVSQQLRIENEKIDLYLKHSKMQAQKLENTDLNELLETDKENIEENLRAILEKTVAKADQAAHNSASGKILMNNYHQLMKEQQMLSAQIRELQFENQRRRKRTQDWKQKLNQIRQRIFQQNSEKNNIQAQINSLNH